MEALTAIAKNYYYYFFFFGGGGREGTGETVHWPMPTPNFENFFSFPIFLKSSVLSLKLFGNS